MGETRVDLLHLLEDLQDAYPGSLEETILTEIIANALDSGARVIRLDGDPSAGALTVTDDGRGMSRRDLARYHDLAATTKQRGRGIGFAGVGIKLGLLACDEVVTETRAGKSHVATAWHLQSRRRAPWRWVPPPGMVPERGTGVRLTPTNRLSALLDQGFLETCIQRHFAPLLDPAFEGILSHAYPAGIRFAVNGRALPRQPEPGERAHVSVLLPRKRKPSGSGYLTRAAYPLSEPDRGLAISTLGKVIKRGWDWLGVTPSAPELVSGIVEVPPLAECLTLNKADFLRTGPRGALYLAYRKAIQEGVAPQLAAWGDLRDDAQLKRERRVRPLERDLRAVLAGLADQFPLLATLMDRRPGGQRRLPLGAGSAEGQIVSRPPTAQDAATQPSEAAPGTELSPPESSEPSAPPVAETVAPRGPRRPAHYGLAIRFERFPPEAGLARLIESTVWVNEAHPAFERAAASRSEGYHVALAVAMALAPLAVEAADGQAFITAFLTEWGEAGTGGRDRKGRKR